MVNHQALVNLTHFRRVLLHLYVLRHRLQPRGQIRQRLGIVQHRRKVQPRFAQHYTWIRAQALEGVLPHHVQPLHGLGLCPALQNHRVCIGSLVHRARLRLAILSRRKAGM